MAQLLNQTYSNECNLEKIFAQGSSSNKSIVMKVASAIPVFEIIRNFAERQRLDVPLIFDSEVGEEEHFWYAISKTINIDLLCRGDLKIAYVHTAIDW